MSISDELIDRISTETGRRLVDKARTGRRQALAAIAKVEVVLTTDGNTTWTEIFDRPPTLRQIAERAGIDTYVVSVRMRRMSLRERIALRIAAE
jgi:hypothetical protein